MARSSISSKIKDLVAKRNEIKIKIHSKEMEIFKLENKYLELAQGQSLLRTLEFYIHSKPEKKKKVDAFIDSPEF